MRIRAASGVSTSGWSFGALTSVMTGHGYAPRRIVVPVTFAAAAASEAALMVRIVVIRAAKYRMISQFSHRCP